MSSNKSESIQTIKISRMKIQDHKSVSDQAVKTQLTKESAQRQSQLSQARQIISAGQIQKLAKDDDPVFLAIIIGQQMILLTFTGEREMKGRRGHVARFSAHGLTEGQKRLMNRKTGPKKDIIYSQRKRTTSSRQCSSSLQEISGNTHKGVTGHLS